MKKCHALRKRLLAIVAIVAITFAGSCSKDATVEPDGATAALQTRSTPQFAISCTPDAKGEGKNLLSMKETYRFVGTAGIMNGFGLVANKVCSLNFRAADGSAADFEVTKDSDQFGEYYDVKFIKSGYYFVTAEYANAEGVLYQQTWTYCVVSRAKSVTLPDKIELGVPFDLKFVFGDTRYPAPTIEITETLFNNPQYTVLGNDGHGNIRLRIDQPGKYQISTGFGGMFSAWADIKLYWRPENLSCESIEAEANGEVQAAFNTLYLCDGNNIPYTSLPYGVYFKYDLNPGPALEGEVPEEISGEKLCRAGTGGTVFMPASERAVNNVFFTPVSIRLHRLRAWHLTVPKDEISWLCVHDPDDVIIVDPDNPGGVIDPMDPDFPIRP